MDLPRTAGATEERTLQLAQTLSLSLLAGVLIATAVVWWVHSGRTPSLSVLVFPAALAGLIAPVIGYRVYLRVRERSPDGADAQGRCAAFVRATLVALALTETVALFGIVVFLLSGARLALSGVAAHVLLTGAIWPSRARLDVFLSDAGS